MQGSAFIHLLAVELLPAWSFGYSLYYSVKQTTRGLVSVHVVVNEVGAIPGLLYDVCLSHAVSWALWHVSMDLPIRQLGTRYEPFCSPLMGRRAFRAAAANATSGNATAAGVPYAAPLAGVPDDMRVEVTLFVFYIGAFYAGIALTAALVAWIIGSFFFAGISDFRSGKYLQWTSELQKHTAYRIIVNALVAFTCVVLGYTFYLCANPSVENRKLGLYVFITEVSFPYFCLILSARSLGGAPSAVPMHRWGGDEFDRITFQRSAVAMVSQSNDSFSLILTNALWQASAGDTEPLEGLIEGDGDVDAERYLELFRRLQRREDMSEFSGSEMEPLSGRKSGRMY